MKAFGDPKKLHRAFPASGRYLVGVSGGRDSVALLHWLVQGGYDNLVVCHLNHSLRGRSSSADARFVEKLASRSGLPFETVSADVRAIAAKEKMSIETAARKTRYAFFGKTAKRRRTRIIFLGHHADDLVETLLLNLFRGAGTSGLAAMREISERCADDADLTIVRPLLDVWRGEINKYVRANRLAFREDDSNTDLTPLRNRIRRRVIPYLEKTFARNIRQNIWRTAVIAGEEENFFETLLPANICQRPLLAVQPLRKMPIAVQRRILHQWLCAAHVTDVGFEVIERVRELLDPAGGVAKTNLSGNRHVRRRTGHIFIE